MPFGCVASENCSAPTADSMSKAIGGSATPSGAPKACSISAKGMPSNEAWPSASNARLAN